MKYDITVAGNSIDGRQGYAYVCNSGEVTVLKAVLNEESKKSSTYFEFGNVKVIKKIYDGTFLPVVGRLVCSEGTWSVESGGCCLSASFTAQDRLELVNDSQLQSLKQGDIVCIATIWEKVCMLQMFKVGRIDIHCQTMTTLQELTSDEMQDLVKKAERWCSR